ncbi:MAG: GAF domain-containing protein, partial [Candidatus Sulfotelmatobacter sp.]
KEEIPIGARILSAVDCLDALASDRQYRKALPLDEAMAKVASEAGAAFDPRVVDILRQRYVEWEKLARLQPAQTPPKLSTDIKVERGLAPDAGFADSAGDPRTASPATGSLERVTAARQQAQNLIELSRGSNRALTLDDTLSLLSARLKRLVPHESMVVYLRKNDLLVAEFVSGENFRLFSSLKVPLGKGLSGWVAQNHKPILNGNPLVEPGYLNDAAQGITMRSALAVPIEGSVGVAAVLALYRLDQDAFSKEDLQVLETIVARLGGSLEQTLPAKASVAHVGGD